MALIHQIISVLVSIAILLPYAFADTCEPGNVLDENDKKTYCSVLGVDLDCTCPTLRECLPTPNVETITKTCQFPDWVVYGGIALGVVVVFGLGCCCAKCNRK